MLDISFHLFDNIYYLITSESFQRSIDIIKATPQFLGDKVQWGIDASFKAMGFMAVLVLGVSMFRSR